LISSPQTSTTDEIRRSLTSFPIDLLKIYPRSFCSKKGLQYGLIRTSEGKKLFAMGTRENVLKDPFRGNCHHQSASLKLCDLSPENTECLMDLFPYTKSVSLRGYSMTVGVEDCLGWATPGHIRGTKKFQVHPVLAQQYIEENAETRRNFTQMIQDAAWAIFQENYQEGYGAVGAHLKSLQEVKEALDAGASMVTLDLTGKISPEAFQDPKELIDRRFKEEIDEGDAKVTFHLFLDKEFVLKGREGQVVLCFDEEGVKRNTLFFYKALDFIEEVYQVIRSKTGNGPLVDFGISMEEAPFPTLPENHFFFALELSHRGVHIQSLAPQFVGEFQKGMDDREDREAFRRQFIQHLLIAQDYGNYKISIHSERHKLSTLSEMGGLSNGPLHLKTVCKSGLEAMRLVALKNPSLFREIHRYALSLFNETSKRHPVATDLSQIPNLRELHSQELPRLFDQEDSRELLHFTYGYLLHAEDKVEKNLLRDHLYHTLTQYEEEYWSLLEKHIENHLNSFGIKKRERQKRRSRKNGEKESDENFDL
jgi:hypothetical protein